MQSILVPYEKEILERYQVGDSPAMISKYLTKYGLTVSRSTVSHFIKRKGKLRSVSESAKIAFDKGRKDKCMSAFFAAVKGDRTKWKECPWKGKSELHPHWIEDRSKLKWPRDKTKEKVFMKEALVKANYTCQLTGQQGILSVHHIKPVWTRPDLTLDHDNVVVITKAIHQDFHKRYGTKTTEEKWLQYVNNREYNALEVGSSTTLDVG